MAAARSRASTVYYVAFAVLVLCLALGAFLFLRLVGNDDAATRFEVSQALATPCPAGQRAPLCYRFEVTNVGGTAASARCVVVAESGTTAMFLEGGVEQSTLLNPSGRLSLDVKVDATEGNVVSAPAVRCSPL